MSLQFECHQNWNFSQILMSLKLECPSNINITQIGRQNILKGLKILRPLRGGFKKKKTANYPLFVDKGGWVTESG